jgi:hypothetical protein
LWFSIQGGRTTRYERRSANLVKLTFNADGTIPKVPWFGVGNPTPGVPQVGTFNPYDTVQAETICFSKGVRTEVCKDSSGKMDVDSIHNGDYIKVKGADFGEHGTSRFEARVASGSNGGRIEVHLDTTTGPLVATCDVSGTGGWQTWKTVSCDVSGAEGNHDIYFKFTGGSGLLFNFNWWRFENPVAVGTEAKREIAAPAEVAVQVRTGASGNRALLIGLSRSETGKKVTVQLYGINGRLAATLFRGTVVSGALSIPIDRTRWRTGGYIVRVLIEGNVVKNGVILLT